MLLDYTGTRIKYIQRCHDPLGSVITLTNGGFVFAEKIGSQMKLQIFYIAGDIHNGSHIWERVNDKTMNVFLSSKKEKSVIG